MFMGFLFRERLIRLGAGGSGPFLFQVGKEKPATATALGWQILPQLRLQITRDELDRKPCPFRAQIGNSCLIRAYPGFSKCLIFSARFAK